MLLDLRVRSLLLRRLFEILNVLHACRYTLRCERLHRMYRTDKTVWGSDSWQTGVHEGSRGTPALQVIWLHETCAPSPAS